MSTKTVTPHGVEIEDRVGYIAYTFESATFKVSYGPLLGSNSNMTVARILSPEAPVPAHFVSKFGADDLLSEDGGTVFVLSPISEHRVSVPPPVALEIYRVMHSNIHYELGTSLHATAVALARALTVYSGWRRNWAATRPDPESIPAVSQALASLPPALREPDRLALATALHEARTHPLEILRLTEPGLIF